MFCIKKAIKSKDIKINYIFFLFWAVFSLVPTFVYLSIIKAEKALFFFHSLSQISLEIFLIAFVIFFLQRFISNKLSKIFIGLIFVFFLGKVINFLMLSIMDSPISYAIHMLFGNGIKGFIVNLQATEINNFMIFSGIFAIFLLPFLGYLGYITCEKLQKKIHFKDLYLSFSFILKTTSLLLIAVLCFNLKASHLPYSELATYKTRLPYDFSNNKKLNDEIKINKTYFSKAKESNIDQTIKTLPAISDKKNVFIFVIEALRKDFINYSTAPCLSQFRDDNIYSTNSFSNANCTQLSWFSIFYSKYPTKWTHYKNKWSEGATSLKIFKQLGYDINVFSGADLSYFDMDKTLFGKAKNNIDYISEFKDKKSWLRDQKAFKALEQKIEENKNDKNNVYIVFLDSTHSEYGWPDDFEIKFRPITNGINYLKIPFSHSDIPLLKNRYKNAINYLDSLFQHFFNNLKKLNLYENSTIVITADHGEEFFEENSLFHGTHLNKYQTNIPIFYKIPGKSNNLKYLNQITSQVDIFPTIFQYLLKDHPLFNEKSENLFDGNSIFYPSRKSFCLCSSQNGPDKPNKFAVYEKDIKTVVNLTNDNILEIEEKSNLKENTLR